MKITFEEWGEWDTNVASVVIAGEVDGVPFGIAFDGDALAEIFEVPNNPDLIETAFMRRQEFMNEIARELVEAGRLKRNALFLTKADLLPYFEKRAATVPV